MSKRKLLQLIVAAFLVISLTLLIPNTEWGNISDIWGFVSLVLGVCGSIIAIFIPTSYVFYFEDTRWVKDNSGYKIIIDSKKHGCGKSPQVKTYEINGNSCTEVDVSSKHDEKGNLTIEANSIFKGKAIIK